MPEQTEIALTLIVLGVMWIISAFIVFSLKSGFFYYIPLSIGISHIMSPILHLIKQRKEK